MKPAYTPYARWDLWFALVLAAAFIGLNLYDAATIPFWSDEGWTITLVTGVLDVNGLIIPVGDVAPTESFQALVAQPGPYNRIAASLYTQDTHPPVYFQTLWAWIHLFGISNLGLRSLSLVCMAVTAGLLFWYGRQRAGAAALVALTFSFTNPGAVYAAVNARGYGLAILLVAVALIGFLQAIKSERHVQWAALAGAASGLAVITHYFSILTLLPAGLAAFAFMAARRRWMSVGATLLAAAVPSYLALTVWLPQQIGARPKQMRGFDDIGIQALSLFRVFVNQFTRYTLDNIGVAIATTVVAGALLGGILAFGRRGWKNPDIAIPFAGFLGFLLGLLALFWATDKTLFAFSVPRYGTLSMPALALLLVQFVPTTWRNNPRAVLPLVAILLAVGIAPRMNHANFDHPWANQQVVADGHKELKQAGQDALIVLTGTDPGRLGVSLYSLPDGMDVIYTPNPTDLRKAMETFEHQTLVVGPISWESIHDPRGHIQPFADVAAEAGYSTDGRVWTKSTVRP
jgi:uncharacterized membrane protein